LPSLFRRVVFHFGDRSVAVFAEWLPTPSKSDQADVKVGALRLAAAVFDGFRILRAEIFLANNFEELDT
jgi:hypothetical protein